VFTNPTVLEAEVLVWAGICHDDRTQIKIAQGTLNAIKYRNDILDPIVLPFLHQRNFDHVFQHDHAICHVARVCQHFLNQNHIRVLPSSALSSDLPPIEHLWVELGRRVRHLQNPPETLQELRDALVHEWNNIPQAIIQRLIGSMCRRAKLSLLEEVVTHVTELRKPQYCMTISVCP
jgi:hypothetical protein